MHLHWQIHNLVARINSLSDKDKAELFRQYLSLPETTPFNTYSWSPNTNTFTHVETYDDHLGKNQTRTTTYGELPAETQKDPMVYMAVGHAKVGGVDHFSLPFNVGFAEAQVQCVGDPCRPSVRISSFIVNGEDYTSNVTNAVESAFNTSAEAFY